MEKFCQLIGLFLLYSVTICEAVGPKCFQCDHVLDPKDCAHYERCNENEQCYVQRYSDQHQVDYYKMGCMPINACSQQGSSLVGSLVGKRQTRVIAHAHAIDEAVPKRESDLPICLECCNGDYCNIHNALCGSLPTTSSGTLLPSTDCFYDSKKYQGAYVTTTTGANCVVWSTVYLQESMSALFPDNSLREAKNRCRDPTGRGHPWCFTSTNNDWEYCPVPFCEQCYFAGQSQLYSGYKNTDMIGNECEFWKNLSFVLPDNNFIDGSKVAAENYCRNPFPKASQADSSSVSEPICFTNGGFKSCGVKQCPEACHDHPSTNCNLVKSYVCQNEYTSITLCPNTCGRCNFGLLPGIVKQPPTDFCEDNPTANCLALQDLICPDPDGARTLCPKTCNQCRSMNTPVTNTPTTNKPRTYTPTQVQAAHWLEWGSYICQVKSNVCLMSRYRICSSGTNSDCGTQSNSIQLCTKKECPDEINHLNMLSNSSPTSTKETTASTQTTVTTVNSCRDSGAYSCHLVKGVCDDINLKHECNRTCDLCGDSCRDSGAYDCSLVKDAVCDDNSLKYDCNKTCDLCGCRDVLQCTSFSSLCSDADLAVKYCKKTCNKCSLPEVPIIYNACKDPVANDSICNTLQSEIGLCQNPDLVQLCPNYCSGRCGPIATCKACPSGRSIQSRHTVIQRVLKTQE